MRCMLGGVTTVLRTLRSSTSISARTMRCGAFAERHIGPSPAEQQQMLDLLGFTTLNELTDKNVPKQIKLEKELELPEPIDEHSMLRELGKISQMNKTYRSYIGMGYYDTIVPAVILRNVTQNIGWISQYTPYQAEISQGRLESLLNFQTMIADLTGLPTTNASLLDEATAVAEAVALSVRATKRNKGNVSPGYSIRCESMHSVAEAHYVCSCCVSVTLNFVYLLCRGFSTCGGDDTVEGSSEKWRSASGWGLARQGSQGDPVLLYATLQISDSYAPGFRDILGYKDIAKTIHKSTAFLQSELAKAGHHIAHNIYFDTLKVTVKDFSAFKQRAEEKQMNFRFFTDGAVGVSLDETTKPADLVDMLYVFNGATKLTEGEVFDIVAEKSSPLIGNSVHARTSLFLQHPIFNSFHSEAQLVRYIKRLENKDVSLAQSMIPLGSCTMKLNASAELIPITWSSFNGLHPFAPISQATGYQRIFNDLEKWLCEITGYDNISLQPNSGANGEYAGLLTIRNYHISSGQEQRKVCLIPTSAHGTNPASANMANMRVVVVDSDRYGNINYKDLAAKAEKYKNELAAIMITYPSTHGVFESSIRDVCDKVHENGGQVYLDGANMNAQVGLCRPGRLR
ncbi:hypothetical protein KIN20_012378 [Parelaphostrongylus tenuis]|uniref:Glycine cleavage system P-protein N-terminal domain-containing protein n=1 Tax=Parelaphostrongylus tenuis TaxID=148309 RepID=A0AAD5QQE8_PARTN|nr:hypothetical protein KIN20_012378 [Parelaphostrongylus tenuis]